MRIGIDLGGTKIEVIALDNDGRVLQRSRRPTPAGDYAATLEAILGLVRGTEAETAATGTVGIGIPGSLSPATGLIRNANSTWLNGRPLQQDLEALLERPLRLANDADCFALSEARNGAGQGHRVVFGVILGTGTGGGLAVEGQLLHGPNAITGEWGHNPLPWMTADEYPESDCWCGRRGCLETFLSGPALAAHFAAATGRRLDARQIAAAAEIGDADATAQLASYEQRLARGLAGIVNILDPDIIVLGGGLSKMSRLYRNVPPLMRPYLFSDVAKTPIRPPLHGDSSGVRGAAWLWPAQSLTQD